MIYIYNDYAGTHSTALAAAYHLHKLPTDRKLTKDEILHVDYFNKLTRKDFGKFFLHGMDEDGNPVYSIGRKRSKLMVPALKQLSIILQERYGQKEKIIFSNTSPTVPIAMSMGGFFSRGIHLDFIGVPLLVMGAKQACGTIQQLVEHTKQTAKSSSESIIVLDNQNFK
ncbi:DUF3189 family protein [Bacillus sp. JJ1533]|uniref:DUF3189 family protein n=1 Tax=Bacillus sp. JJ1533 TaxID=3122959 RepID=UPI002FFF46E0